MRAWLLRCASSQCQTVSSKANWKSCLKMATYYNALTRTNLRFPLAWRSHIQCQTAAAGPKRRERRRPLRRQKSHVAEESARRGVLEFFFFLLEPLGFRWTWWGHGFLLVCCCWISFFFLDSFFFWGGSLLGFVYLERNMLIRFNKVLVFDGIILLLGFILKTCVEDPGLVGRVAINTFMFLLGVCLNGDMLDKYGQI